VPVAFPKDVAVNCRLGPNVAWIVLSGLNVGASAQIVGRTADNGWWYIVDPFNSARRCWVAASVTNTAGNLAGIPVAEAPSAQVTDVSVDVDPNEISVAGCVGPIQPVEISGTIETNGTTFMAFRNPARRRNHAVTEFDTFAKSFCGLTPRLPQERTG
jgi:hypothetical protein